MSVTLPGVAVLSNGSILFIEAATMVAGALGVTDTGATSGSPHVTRGTDAARVTRLTYCRTLMQCLEEEVNKC